MSDLVKNPYAAFEDKADPSVPTATLQIYDFIGKSLEKPKEDINVNRASSATNCPKRRWYQRTGVQGTPLTPRKLMNFMLGDLVEMVTLHFIKEACVGPGKLYSEVDFGEVVDDVRVNDKVLKTYKQKTLTTKVDDLVVTCHADGFGKRNSDGEWELIECKSSANWGFQTFKSDGPEDYLNQSHTCMSSEEAKMMGVKSVRYFYMRKETGHIWDRLFYFDPVLWENVRKDFLRVMQPEEMPAPYQLVPEMQSNGRGKPRTPTGKMIAQFPCTYCPYLENCKGKFTVEWKEDQNGNFKPNYIFAKV